jgi:hypothetical protein
MNGPRREVTDRSVSIVDTPSHFVKHTKSQGVTCVSPPGQAPQAEQLRYCWIFSPVYGSNFHCSTGRGWFGSMAAAVVLTVAVVLVSSGITIQSTR